MIEKMTRKQYDEDKDPKWPDDTSSVDIEEGVIDRKDKRRKFVISWIWQR